MTPQKAAIVTLRLDYPIEYQGASITELKVRRPKGKDMRFLPAGENTGVEQMFPFFGLLAGIEEGVLDEMDASDLSALGELVNGFLSNRSRRKSAK